MKKYNGLTISEFAKLCNTNRKTLIFYDNINIFKPAYKDEKGYRFYNIKQYDAFSILVDLREIGVSLEEIKKYLDNKSPNKYLELLNKEKEKTLEKINKLNKIYKTVENKINTTEVGIGAINKLDPYIKEAQEEYYVKLDVKDSSNEGIMLSVIDLIKESVNEEIYCGYNIGAMVSRDNIIRGEYSNITKITMRVDRKISKCNLIIKERGTYAIINHKGNYEDTYNSYEKLLKYIKDNGYKIVSDSYENSLLEMFALENEEEYLTEICIKVEK
ncbi:MAG: MerR family transcriptional regulator [Clostridium sp.]|uniref:MerR family transcriptional regulator n=1 Tax=Clostridium sp. TaxID=1506 RepID=UPI003F3A78E3